MIAESVHVEVQTLSVAELTSMAAPYNPRTISEHDLAALGRSMTTFGVVEPIVVNRRTGHIVGGHQRVTAAAVEGLRELPVVHVDLDEAQEKQLNLALNRISGAWDDEALASLMLELKTDEADLGLTGFEDAEIAKLLRDAEGASRGDPDATPAIEDTVHARLGDAIRLGPHTLVCGDARDPDVVEDATRQRTASLVVTSPPYNCDMEYDHHDDDMDRDEYLGLLRAVVESCVRVLDDGCFVAWNVGVTPKSCHFDHARILSESSLSFYRQIVWAKAGVARPIWQFTRESCMARKFHPNYVHEMIYLFVKGDPVVGGPCEVDDDYGHDVWHVNQALSSRDLPDIGPRDQRTSQRHPGFHKRAAHPAAFPVGIPSGAVRHLTSRGEVVLDPFAGSGTTIIACEQLGRVCGAVEIDPRYVDVAVRRWQDYTGEKAEGWRGNA